MEEEGQELVNTELTGNLRKWIELDDESRRITERLKEIRVEKATLGGSVLSFMRENELDDFKLEGMSTGTLSRSVRTIKPALKRNTIRTQLLIHFGDQPSKVSEALRAIEGIGEGEDAMSVGIQKEMLTRRLPRKPRNQSAIQLNG
jgi:hypothetical protein